MRLLVIGYWLLVIGYWLLVIGYWLLVAQAFENVFFMEKHKPRLFRRKYFLLTHKNNKSFATKQKNNFFFTIYTRLVTRILFFSSDAHLRVRLLICSAVRGVFSPRTLLRWLFYILKTSSHNFFKYINEG